MVEVRWGLAVGVALIAIAVWVAWKGQNPDPSLYAAVPLAGGEQASEAGDRGAIPEGLAAPGWTEGQPSQFDAANLYVKINGRADYFFSYGFERLYFISLRNSAADDAASVEIEMYDLGSAANALGAFSGERKEGSPEAVGAGLSHLSRNALFVARGSYYVRAIGSEESEAMTAQLTHIKDVLIRSLADAARPWAYELFSGQLELPAATISYAPVNAFSFDFASDVYSARLADDTQLLVAVVADAAAAAALAAAFRDGFAELGERSGEWAIDRYLGTFATAAANDRFVIGVRGAPDRDRGVSELSRLREGLAALPAAVRDGARPAPPPTQTAGGGDSYEADEPATGPGEGDYMIGDIVEE